MIKLGLTGSIGMGKSTVLNMFKSAGAAVFDADSEVHKLYEKGGAATAIIKAVFPDAIVEGEVDRVRLSKHLQNDPLHIQVLESFIHPLVQKSRTQILEQAKTAGKSVFIADIPLLFETGAEDQFDKIIVVSAAPAVQRARVMARPGMSAAKFQMINSRQMSDALKRKRADYIIRTDKGLKHTQDRVLEILHIVQTAADKPLVI